MWKSIWCLDNFTREDWFAGDFFYDTIELPVKLGTDINITKSYRTTDKTSPTFKLRQDILSTLKTNKISYKWPSWYYELPEILLPILDKYIDENTLLIGFEIHPWLKKFSASRGVTYIDLRISPIRFARDLYIAADTNNSDIQKKLFDKQVNEDEFRLEASFLSASMGHIQRYDDIPEVEGAYIIIGQTGDDASLIASDGKFQSLSNFQAEIREIVGNHPVYYNPHPMAHKNKKIDLSILNSIFSQKTKISHSNIYTLLGSKKNLKFLGLSSGSLQEAHYFEKESFTLFKPICPLTGKEAFTQLHYHHLLSPGFWHQLISPTFRKPSIDALPNLSENNLRRTYNAWWGYNKVLLENNHLFNDAISIIKREVGLKAKIKNLINKI